MSVMQSHYDKLEALKKKHPKETIAALARKHKLNAEYHSRIKMRQNAKNGRRHRVERIDMAPASSGVSGRRLDMTIQILLGRASDTAKQKIIDILVDDHFKGNMQ